MIEYPNSKYVINIPIKKYIIRTKIECDNKIKTWTIPKYSLLDKLKFFFQDKKLISSWEIIYDIKIYDPDGWDRTDPYLFNRYYTREEFETGITFSTCITGEDSIEYCFGDLWSYCLKEAENESNKRWDIIVGSMIKEENVIPNILELPYYPTDYAHSKMFSSNESWNNNINNIWGYLKMNINPCLICNTIPKFDVTNPEFLYKYKTNWAYLKCDCKDDKGNHKIITSQGHTIDNAKTRAIIKWNRKNPIKEES
jgi:hypothetical protein